MWNSVQEMPENTDFFCNLAWKILLENSSVPMHPTSKNHHPNLDHLFAVRDYHVLD